MSLNEGGGGLGMEKIGGEGGTFNTIGKKYKLSYKNTLVEEGPGSVQGCDFNSDIIPSQWVSRFG